MSPTKKAGLLPYHNEVMSEKEHRTQELREAQEEGTFEMEMCSPYVALSQIKSSIALISAIMH